MCCCRWWRCFSDVVPLRFDAITYHRSPPAMNYITHYLLRSIIIIIIKHKVHNIDEMNICRWTSRLCVKQKTARWWSGSAGHHSFEWWISSFRQHFVGHCFDISVYRRSCGAFRNFFALNFMRFEQNHRKSLSLQFWRFFSLYFSLGAFLLAQKTGRDHAPLGRIDKHTPQLNRAHCIRMMRRFIIEQIDRGSRFVLGQKSKTIHHTNVWQLFHQRTTAMRATTRELAIDGKTAPRPYCRF